MTCVGRVAGAGAVSAPAADGGDRRGPGCQADDHEDPQRRQHSLPFLRRQEARRSAGQGRAPHAALHQQGPQSGEQGGAGGPVEPLHRRPGAAEARPGGEGWR